MSVFVKQNKASVCKSLRLSLCSCAGYVDDGEVISPKVQGLSSPSAESVCVSCEGDEASDVQ